MKGGPTVFLVSSDPEAGEQLRRLVRSSHLGVEVYPSAGDFLGTYDPDRAGCLVLDLRAPLHGDSRADSSKLRAEEIRTPVVFVVGPRELPIAGHLSASSASDLSEAPLEPSSLLDVIQWAIGDDTLARAERLRRAEILTRRLALTRREREVMSMVVNGMSNRRIGDQFGISSRTVEVHRAHLMEKMGAGSLSDLVRMAFVAGGDSGRPGARSKAFVYRLAPESEPPEKKELE
jgi:FixJ family two-component response regulator